MKILDTQRIWIGKGKGVSIVGFDDGTFEIAMLIGTPLSWMIDRDEIHKFENKELVGEYLLAIISSL